MCCVELECESVLREYKRDGGDDQRTEFIFDFYDVIEDKRLETEEEEIPV